VTDWEKAFGEMEAAWRYAESRCVAADARVAELERDLHFSETMHQADLDQRIVLEEALRFYANEESWSSRTVFAGDSYREVTADESYAIQDAGETARAALAGVPVAEPPEEKEPVAGG
jgi:hypothetical protein